MTFTASAKIVSAKFTNPVKFGAIGLRYQSSFDTEQAAGMGEEKPMCQPSLAMNCTMQSFRTCIS